MKRVFLCLIAPVFLFVMSGSALSFDYNTQGGDTPAYRRVCSVLKESVGKGEDIKKVVKTSIEMGYNACNVIKCAISGGGDLNQIIGGAIETGVTPDVVARCAIDSGAEATEVVRCLSRAGMTSLCYLEPGGYGYSQPEDNKLVPTDPIPRKNDPRRLVSPSSF